MSSHSLNQRGLGTLVGRYMPLPFVGENYTNMIFSVTYNLALHNAIFIYCTSHIPPSNTKLVVWTL